MSELEHDYAVFRGDNYYPSGGWGDFHKSYGEDLDRATKEARAWLDAQEVPCWYQIVDLKTGTIIEENST